MEVDMHAPASPSRSSSFGVSASTRPVITSFDLGAESTSLATRKAAKRTRSPVSDSLTHDRPLKRLSLGFGMQGQSYNHGNGIAVPQPTYASQVATGMSASSDDWVAKASGLRIASPLVAVDRTIPEARSGRDSVVEDDADMADEDVQMASVPSQVVFDLAPPREDEPPEPYMTSLLPPSPSAPSNFLSIPGQPGLTTNGIAHLSIPDIQVQHATPSPIGESPDSAHGPGSAHGQSRPGSVHTFSEGALLAPSRGKQRVTMGPRADCEKCRMGVRGHWMHYD